jgi:tungstate transport system ATP-binding protein
MSPGVLELGDVAVEYDGRVVLDVQQLTVARGEVLTLLGENGSGKTTLLRLLGLLVPPARGKVVFGEEEVDFGSSGRLLEHRRRMAAVMQEPLLCRMSVGRNVALGLRFRRLPKAEIQKRVEAWLERLSISHLADRPASKLSGGEAQRTSLARAMALNPEVLLLDEPFGALDAPTRQRLLQEFRGVLAESGVTAVYATHDRGEALALGDRVAVLVEGQVAQVDSVEVVFSRPCQAEVARIVGIETMIPGRISGREGDRVQVDCGAFHLQAPDRKGLMDDVVVAVRPEEVEIREEGDAPPSEEWNALSGSVTKVLPAETHYRVEVDCSAPVVAVVSRARYRTMDLEPGARVRASFPIRAAHLIPRDK